MNSPLETLVREVIRAADKNTSWVEICTVCEYEHYPFSIAGPLALQGFDEVKYQLVGWIYCCSIVQHK